MDYLDLHEEIFLVVKREGMETHSLLNEYLSGSHRFLIDLTQVNPETESSHFNRTISGGSA